jgi:GT2 family glycosyltransferase
LRNKQVKVSVIIPTFRAEASLGRAVASIRRERRLGAEIVLVDNGCRGMAKETVEAMAGRIDRLIHLKKNQGYAGGNNRGAEAAEGDILFLLNDDAWLLPGALEAVVETFERHPEVGVIGCKIFNEDGKTLQHVEVKMNRQGFSRHVGAGDTAGPEYSEPRDVEYITGAAWAIRRDVWDEIGGLAETYFPGYFEEVEFCWTARALGWRVRYVPDAAVVHLGMQTTGRYSQRYFFYYHRSRIRFLLRTSTRRELSSIIRAELSWILRFRNWDQYPALFLAYLLNFLTLPHILRGRKKLWKLVDSGGTGAGSASPGRNSGVEG